MKKIYFTVGPSQIYPGMDRFLLDACKKDILSMSHRGSKFALLYEGVENKLKKLLSIPNDYCVFFLSSGTEGMEQVLQNCVAQKSFHIISGAFGKRFFAIAKELGKSPIAHDFTNSKDIMFPETELVGVTENDTSTGITFPMKILYEYKKKNPEALIAVDVVSSVPYCNLQYSSLDAVFFSVQKGFGLPAGLGILVASPQALEKSSKIKNTGTYHSFKSLSSYRAKWQTPETPNVLAIYLLDRVLEAMLKTGIKKIRSDTDTKAELLYDFFDKSGNMKPFITDRTLRSMTTPVIDTPSGSAKILTSLAKKGFIVGTGYGDKKDSQIRIANFPAQTVSDVKNLLKAIATLSRT